MDGLICPRCHHRQSDAEDPAAPELARCPADGYALITPETLADGDGDPFLGRTVAGRYVILGKLGAGSMGTVYMARQEGMGRNVAVKILRPDRVIDTFAKARFVREARAMSLLTSPHTVTVFDFGEIPAETAVEGVAEDVYGAGPSLYLTMEMLEGESLGQRLRRSPRLPQEEAVRIARQALLSLAEAHEKGVIHRDLKPDNLFLAKAPGGDHDEMCKVLDFGIAKVRGDRVKGVDALETQAGMVFGTPRYMSPEQAQGRALDLRSDLYTLGLLLYQMLVGQPPFLDDDAVVVMAHHIKTKPVPPVNAAPDASIDRALSDLIMRALSKDASERPASAREFIAELDRVTEQARAERKSKPPSSEQGSAERKSKSPPVPGNAERKSKSPPVPGNAERKSKPPPVPGNAERASKLPPEPGSTGRASKLPPEPGSTGRTSKLPPEPGSTGRASKLPPEPGSTGRTSRPPSGQGSAERKSRPPSERESVPGGAERKSRPPSERESVPGGAERKSRPPSERGSAERRSRPPSEPPRARPGSVPPPLPPGNREVDAARDGLEPNSLSSPPPRSLPLSSAKASRSKSALIIVAAVAAGVLGGLLVFAAVHSPKQAVLQTVSPGSVRAVSVWLAVGVSDIDGDTEAAGGALGAGKAAADDAEAKTAAPPDSSGIEDAGAPPVEAGAPSMGIGAAGAAGAGAARLPAATGASVPSAASTRAPEISPPFEAGTAWPVNGRDKEKEKPPRSGPPASSGAYKRFE